MPRYSVTFSREATYVIEAASEEEVRLACDKELKRSNNDYLLEDSEWSSSRPWKVNADDYDMVVVDGKLVCGVDYEQHKKKQAT